MDGVGVFGGPVAVGHQRQRGADPRELAQHRAQLVDVVRGERSEPAATLRRVGPPVRHLSGGVGEDRQVEDEGGHARLRDDAFPHRPRGQRLRGREAELGAEQVDDAGRLRPARRP